MFRKAIINALFSALQSFLIDKITVEPLKNYILSLLAPAKKVADLLTDSNPNNGEQLMTFWLEHQKELLNLSIEALKNLIRAKVKDPVLLALILSALDEIDEGTGLRKA